MGMRPHILRQMAQLRTKALVATQLANDRQGWIEALTRGVRSAAQVAITAFATFLVDRSRRPAGRDNGRIDAFWSGDCSF